MREPRCDTCGKLFLECIRDGCFGPSYRWIETLTLKEARERWPELAARIEQER